MIYEHLHKDESEPRAYKPEDKIVSLDLNTMKALHDSVTRETYDFIFNRGKQEVMHRVLKAIDEWFEEEWFGGELGDKDSDIFETSIGSIKNAQKVLRRKLSALTGSALSGAKA